MNKLESKIQKNIPTILVVFGATGDLMHKKIVPALFHLFQKRALPKFFRIVGFSRRNIPDSKFHQLIKEILAKHENIKRKKFSGADIFIKMFSYSQGVFENLSDYRRLSSVLKVIDAEWGVCTNKLFYLAASPQFYKPIFKNLAASGLTKPCSPAEGWTRIIIEKPFGKDLKTATALENLISKLFQELQIYRIDHYLAKEMLQNILAFRFSNNLFEQSWNKDFIEKIEIRLWEKLGVENRGRFYDGLGALRDVGQNHLLQMLALATMEHPINFSADVIRKKREAILKTLVVPSNQEIKKFSYRAQYHDFRTIDGVAKNSTTETYFKVRAFLSTPQWQGVPIILESGKRLKEQRKEIIASFKHPAVCLCPPDQKHYKNKVIIRLEPKEQIVVQFWSKKPGLTFEMEERDFTFMLRKQQKAAQYTEEYEKLLLDCIAGDQTLFVSSEEVRTMWRYTDPIIKSWKNNNVVLNSYKPDTDEPIRASSYIENSAVRPTGIKKEIGLIGLGKMGGNLAEQLLEKGWRVIGYDQTPEALKKLERGRLTVAGSLNGLISKLSPPRLIWLMVPAGKSVDEIIFGPSTSLGVKKDGLIQYLSKGDTVIDGGNSFYQDSLLRFKKLDKKRVNFIDVGVSGGPAGARYGASLMIGGKKRTFQKLEPLFYDLAKSNGYQFFEGPGAGHFVKMIHNGIEYGMMQAMAEGFTILKNAKYKLNLNKVAEVYNHGSVIESRLIGWLKKAFDFHGENLKGVSGAVGHTGEGEWTVKTAKELKIKARVIEAALEFRVQSEKRPSYTGQVLSALREQFGGHSVIKK